VGFVLAVAELALAASAAGGVARAAVLTPDATLAAPGAVFLGPVVASGNTVVADGVGLSSSVPCVFVKPGGGWSNEGPSAALRASDGTALNGDIAVSGPTIVVGQYAFVRPPGGWSGVVQESAKLIVPVRSASVGAVTISGATIFAAVS
jgi:hypothetical protein